jgi:hypothetical protein
MTPVEKALITRLHTDQIFFHKPQLTKNRHHFSIKYHLNS